jgi:hypothetical protein
MGFVPSIIIAGICGYLAVNNEEMSTIETGVRFHFFFFAACLNPSVWQTRWAVMIVSTWNMSCVFTAVYWFCYGLDRWMWKNNVVAQGLSNYNWQYKPVLAVVAGAISIAVLFPLAMYQAWNDVKKMTMWGINLVKK